MEEIGGYFGVECHKATPYHQGVYLNSGSSAMKYIIEKLGIARLYVPVYTCRSVEREVRRAGCQPIPYFVDEQMMPVGDFSTEDFIVYNNYFGVCGKNVKKLSVRCPNLIVDNSQAFYSMEIGLAGFYSPHKFFGVPDGGIARFKDCILNNPGSLPPADHSMSRVSCMLKRMDYDATTGYEDFQHALADLAEAPVCSMSKLTRMLMGNINYDETARIRRANFKHLDAHLHSSFPFAFADDDVPLVYPYVTNDAMLRRKLIANKIYVATYWSDMRGHDNLRDTIVPLPIDQRYAIKDMNRILEVIHG